MGRGFPTRKGEELVIIRLRNTPGRYVVVEDAQHVPELVTWTHDEFGRCLGPDGELIPGNFAMAHIGAQKLLTGDTVDEMYRSFGLGEVTEIQRRPSRCEPRNEAERRMLQPRERPRSIYETHPELAEWEGRGASSKGAGTTGKRTPAQPQARTPIPPRPVPEPDTGQQSGPEAAIDDGKGGLFLF